MACVVGHIPHLTDKDANPYLFGENTNFANFHQISKGSGETNESLSLEAPPGPMSKPAAFTVGPV
jgi:hypothetical protein